MRRALAVLVALALTGCPPDLDGWTVGSGPILPGTDGAIDPPPPGDRCAPPVTCGDCPLPWLLASVEDLGEDCGGQVWRWSLQGRDDAFCACAPLDAGGAIPRLPFAVGFVPPQTVVVAAESDRVMAIDALTDSEMWSAPFSWQPVDVFAIVDDTERMRVGVAGRMRGSRAIRAITFYDAANGGAATERYVNGDLPLGLSVSIVSQSSFDRHWFRALDEMGSYAAADVNPWTNERYMDPYHTRGRDGFYLHTIHSSFDGVFHRTVWTGERSDLDPRTYGVYRLARADDPGSNGVPLSERCQEMPDGSDYDVECEYLWAVADPSLNTSSIAVCGHGLGERRIVRLHSHGGCYTFVEQSEVHPDVRISGLGLAQTTFWP